ncbi:hypothetical protein DFJ74DRAFT_654356 [Hyaloraphidium curvatum]|nr:hypothetical protein DFJ74DRAFT_654356 [Hyaloraphidium curvatum]
MGRPPAPPVDGPASSSFASPSDELRYWERRVSAAVLRGGKDKDALRRTADDDARRRDEFRDTVVALAHIVKNKLYKFADGHDPDAEGTAAFKVEHYFKTWGCSRAQAYRFVDCAPVIAALEDFPHFPSTERLCYAVRTAARADPSTMRRLWSRVLDRVAGPRDVTAALVQQVGDEMKSEQVQTDSADRAHADAHSRYGSYGYAPHADADYGFGTPPEAYGSTHGSAGYGTPTSTSYASLHAYEPHFAPPPPPIAYAHHPPRSGYAIIPAAEWYHQRSQSVPAVTPLPVFTPPAAVYTPPAAPTYLHAPPSAAGTPPSGNEQSFPWYSRTAAWVDSPGVTSPPSAPSAAYPTPLATAQRERTPPPRMNDAALTSLSRLLNSPTSPFKSQAGSAEPPKITSPRPMRPSPGTKPYFAPLASDPPPPGLRSPSAPPSPSRRPSASAAGPGAALVRAAEQRNAWAQRVAAHRGRHKRPGSTGSAPRDDASVRSAPARLAKPYDKATFMLPGPPPVPKRWTGPMTFDEFAPTGPARTGSATPPDCGTTATERSYTPPSGASGELGREKLPPLSVALGGWQPPAVQRHTYTFPPPPKVGRGMWGAAGKA